MKILVLIGVFFFTPLLISFIISLTETNYDDVIKERKENSSKWSVMTYEERQKLLEEMISDKDFENGSELENSLDTAINKEINAEAVYHVKPSIYNGFSNVVEADSGWISLPFRGTYRNYDNDKINFSGSAMLVYHADTKTLSVKNWNVSNCK